MTTPARPGLAAAVRQAANIEAVVAERKKRSIELQNQVAQARYRLERQPEVEAYMLTLQQRVHQRSVGLYEQLLTALIQDVLPENVHPVSLLLDTEKGLPSLSIQLGTGEYAQDIYEDTGGSLTNVVSSGLRFIALARSGLRKFMVLDEPDCWIEPHRVPRFADILSDMASRIHVQAILISHHNDSAFSSISDRHVLEKNSNGVIEVRKTRASVWPDDVVPGIRWIRLQRFMSHLDTKLELGPGINVLSGANHIGKSAIVNALRALCYHKGADRQIMHGHQDFEISVGLEQGRVITCKRVRKGARKTVYSFFEPGMASPRVEPAEKTHPPEFVVNHLNIQRLNDLDIQLSHQKMPVFLLNEPNTKQASLLSAGMESDHVRTMLKEYKSWLDADRLTVRTREKEFLILKETLDAWDTHYPCGGLASRGDALMSQDGQLQLEQQNYQSLLGIIATIEKARLFDPISVQSISPEAPTLTHVQPMLDVVQNWTISQARAVAEPMEQSPATPALPDLVGMASSLRSWAQSAKRAVLLEGAFANLIFPQEPPIIKCSTEENMATWKTLTDKAVSSENAHKTALEESKKSQKNVDELREEAGHQCPLCQQSWPHTHNQ